MENQHTPLTKQLGHATVAETTAGYAAPLSPEIVSAILRDPTSPLYPSRITVFCDDCGTEFSGEYMVSEEQTSAERLEVARAHMRGKGWRCERSGDYCPTHKAENDACPGTGEYGHGLTGTTVHVGCCPASRS